MAIFAASLLAGLLCGFIVRSWIVLPVPILVGAALGWVSVDIAPEQDWGGARPISAMGGASIGLVGIPMIVVGRRLRERTRT